MILTENLKTEKSELNITDLTAQWYNKQLNSDTCLHYQFTLNLNYNTFVTYCKVFVGRINKQSRQSRSRKCLYFSLGVILSIQMMVHVKLGKSCLLYGSRWCAFFSGVIRLDKETLRVFIETWNPLMLLVCLSRFDSVSKSTDKILLRFAVVTSPYWIGTLHWLLL